jgi:hypothetical protein
MEGSLSGFGGDLEDAQHPVMVSSLLRNLTLNVSTSDFALGIDTSV